MVKSTSSLDRHLIDFLSLYLAAEPNVSYLRKPCHNRLFTGRAAYLEKLQMYFRPRDTCRPRRHFLVHGLGGVGKTQLCLRFVEEVSNQLAFLSCPWIALLSSWLDSGEFSGSTQLPPTL